MGAIWKFCSRTELIGFISLVLLFFAFLIFNWLWSVIASIKLVESPVINFLLAIAIFLTVAFGIGLLVRWRWSRSLILRFVSKVPVIGSLAHASLNHDFIEKLKKEGFPEVMFPDVGGRWGLGIVTKEFLAPVSPADWREYNEHPSVWTLPLIEWCVVLGPPTAPLAPTAQMWYCPKSVLVENGFEAKDTFITAASFGFAFQFPKRRGER